MSLKTLKSWVDEGDSPWTYGTARKYARRAVRGEPGFSHLPFVQVVRNGVFLVDVIKFRDLMRKKGGRP